MTLQAGPDIPEEEDKISLGHWKNIELTMEGDQARSGTTSGA